MLHRDISIGNLMMRGNTPFVIDWGCALLNFSGNEREISQKSMVGTAIFMALRVLADAKTRSIIDDLDSLFLMATYCTWIKYDDARSESFKKIWSRLDPFKGIVNTRRPWLSNDEKNL
ncbi:hypothetical protein IWW36_003980 [Coemansia brasiliensis]|uniref:Protein kinase domain-containing protein n=1 Tax=Coemansia brasiliensis TaxID=2650707 RepID=A0A9W8LZ85_9FUNG|nr:hypothetical protein IWW36_003980 [Coemansia brasiliensis]